MSRKGSYTGNAEYRGNPKSGPTRTQKNVGNGKSRTAIKKQGEDTKTQNENNSNYKTDKGQETVKITQKTLRTRTSEMKGRSIYTDK